MLGPLGSRRSEELDVKPTIALMTSLASVALGFSLGVNRASEPQEKAPEPPACEVFRFADLAEKRRGQGRAYLRFLNRPSMSCGVYALAKGATDRQSPHRLDEVYYVVKGQAKLEVGKGDSAKSHEARPGSVLFVQAGAPHRFHDIKEDLELLVFFSKTRAR